MTKQDELTQFLRDHYWKERGEARSPWRWYDPKFPAAHYRAEDAVELIKSQQKTK